jgi:hypothetical protein
MEKAWTEAETIHNSNLANLDPNFIAAKEKEAEETIKSQAAMESNWQERL